HHTAGRAAGRIRALQIFFASQLCRRRRRNRVASARAASALAGTDLHCAERCRARDPDSHRGPRTLRRQRAACTNGFMSCRHESWEKPAIATWAGFLLMRVGMFMAILDIQVVATALPTIQRALAI